MKSVKQLASFLTVGLIAAGVNFFTFYVVWTLFGISYIFASSIAYMLGVITHFLGNRHYTFKMGHIDIMPQLKRYGLLIVINYCITLLVIAVTVEKFHFSPYVGIILAIGLTVMVGFILSQRWIFNENEI